MSYRAVAFMMKIFGKHFKNGLILQIAFFVTSLAFTETGFASRTLLSQAIVSPLSESKNCAELLVTGVKPAQLEPKALEPAHPPVVYKIDPPGVSKKLPFDDELLESWIEDAVIPLPNDTKTIESDNEWWAARNADYLLRFGIERMAKNKSVPTSAAIFAIYRVMVQKHVFILPRGLNTVEKQAEFRKNIFRSQNRLEVVFNSLVPPHSKDIGKLYDLFTSQTELLLSRVKTAREAFALAVWVRRSIIELQPGLDANTRSARAAFNYILARVNESKALGRLRFPLIDLSETRVRNQEILVPEVAISKKPIRLRPYETGASGHGWYDYKDFVAKMYVHNLSKFSKSQRTRNKETEDNATSQSESYFDVSTEEWNAIRDFMKHRLGEASLESIMSDPAIRAEVDFLTAYYTAIMTPQQFD